MKMSITKLHENVVELYDNFKIKFDGWYVNGKLHREDGPALVEYYENGQIMSNECYVNGKLHREDGPALVEYYENGQIKSQKWYENAKLHKNDYSAIINYYENGQMDEYEYLHKKHYPEIIHYYENGYLHKKYYPEIIKYHEYNIKDATIFEYYETGQKWKKDGKYYREDGPSIIEYRENGQINLKTWYNNGNSSKKGPIIIDWKPTKSRYLYPHIAETKFGEWKKYVIRYNKSGQIKSETLTNYFVAQSSVDLFFH